MSSEKTDITILATIIILAKRLISVIIESESRRQKDMIVSANNCKIDEPYLATLPLIQTAKKKYKQ